MMIRGCEGSSAVEFAIIAPFFLAMVGGIMGFGLYLGALHNLKTLAADAARASVAGMTDAERANLARASVTNALSAGAMFSPGSVTVAFAASGTDSTLYNLTLTFDSRALGTGGLAGLVTLPPDLMRASVAVRRGGL